MTSSFIQSSTEVAEWYAYCNLAEKPPAPLLTIDFKPEEAEPVVVESPVLTRTRIQYVYTAFPTVTVVFVPLGVTSAAVTTTVVSSSAPLSGPAFFGLALVVALVLQFALALVAALAVIARYAMAAALFDMPEGIVIPVVLEELEPIAAPIVQQLPLDMPASPVVAPAAPVLALPAPAAPVIEEIVEEIIGPIAAAPMDQALDLAAALPAVAPAPAIVAPAPAIVAAPPAELPVEIAAPADIAYLGTCDETPLAAFARVTQPFVLFCLEVRQGSQPYRAAIFMNMVMRRAVVMDHTTPVRAYPYNHTMRVPSVLFGFKKGSLVAKDAVRRLVLGEVKGPEEGTAALMERVERMREIGGEAAWEELGSPFW